jgi:type VI secretion system protein VasG
MTGLRALVAKLSRTSRAALERATGHCLRQGHFAVEIEHLMIELIDEPGSDLAAALAHYSVDSRAMAGDLARALGRFQIGNSQNAGLSAQLATALESAWLIASLDLGLSSISSACLLRAVAEDSRLRESMLVSAPQLAQLPRQRFADDLPGIVERGLEVSVQTEGGHSPDVDAVREPALAAYAVDLTEAARAGRLDAVIGREAEIDQVIETLMRRRQNNPILTGDAGVGKTAIVEGLAQRIAAGHVPSALAGTAVLALDLGALQAGAGVQGEFERRLRGVIDEIAGVPGSAILFIDEAHMLIGSGGTAGQGDAANLLKPALARGGLRTIAATTWGEYKRYFQKDAALARRFQPIKVEPPSPETTIIILRHLATSLEAYHGVRISEEALGDAARLSQRYIADRHLPDKAINVLDTACARVAIAQSSPPRALDAAELRCAHLDAEIARLEASPTSVADYEERFDQLGAERVTAEAARDALANRWEQELYTVGRIRALETQFGDQPSDALRAELQGLHLELAELQQEDPLVPAAVDRRAIADVVSAWTGVPAGAILGTATASAADLRAMLAARIVGQEAALDTIVRRVQTFQADLNDPTKPTGVFMLCGPSGVGKTETAMALAELLFGGPRSLITVNMSEYQEPHSVSGLKGAPPGYVGYGKGGVLTEAVRRQPYSVVLLDEVEKAHPDVLEIFYQVFDRGMLEDSEGAVVDFTHSLILLTSNAGADVLARAEPEQDAAALAAALQPELRRHFAPAFLARLVIVPYRPLGLEEIEAIVRLKLARVAARFAGARRGTLSFGQDVVATVADQAERAGGGARSVDAIIAHQLLPDLAERMLDRLAEPGLVQDARIVTAADGRLRVELRG